MGTLLDWFRRVKLGPPEDAAGGPSARTGVDQAGPDVARPKPAVDGLSLYHFDSCPFCMRVRRAMKSLGLDIELRDTRRDRNSYEELVDGGGSSQVPCLRIEKENGSVEWLYESSDIIRFLERSFADRHAAEQAEAP